MSDPDAAMYDRALVKALTADNGKLRDEIERLRTALSVDWDFRADFFAQQAIYLEQKAEELKVEAQRHRDLSKQARTLARIKQHREQNARDAEEVDTAKALDVVDRDFPR